MKSGIVIYLIYVAVILTAGYYVYDAMSNSKNPKSLRSGVKELNDVLNENN